MTSTAKERPSNLADRLRSSVSDQSLQAVVVPRRPISGVDLSDLGESTQARLMKEGHTRKLSDVSEYPILFAPPEYAGAFGFSVEESTDLLPSTLHGYLSALDRGVNELDLNKPHQLSFSYEYELFQEKVVILKEKAALIKSKLENHNGLQSAESLSSLLKVVVFKQRHPELDFDQYDNHVDELTSEVILSGLEELAKTGEENFLKMILLVRDFVDKETQKLSKASIPEDFFKQARGSTWLGAATQILPEALNKLEGVEIENLQKIFKAAFAVSSNNFYAAAHLEDIQEQLDLEMKWAFAQQTKAEEQEGLKEKIEAPIKELEAFFYRVAEHMGIKERLPTVQEFSEWAVKEIFEATFDDTKEASGFGSVTFVVGEHEMNLLNIWDAVHGYLPKDHELTQYENSFLDNIFPYAKMAFGSRRYKQIALEHYRSMGDLYKDLDRETRIDRDYLITDIYESAHVVNDGFEVPMIERWRSAQLVYEHLMQIYMISSQEDDFFVKRYQSKPNYKSEAATYFRSSSISEEQAILFSRAKLLTEQPHLGFLTIDEAIFLLSNVDPLSPREMFPNDSLTKSRISLKLFAAAGPVLDDSLKSLEQMKYNAVVQSGLEVNVNDKKPTFTVNGKTVITNSHKIAFINNQWQILESSLVPTGTTNSEDLLSVINRMIEYGARAEECAYDIAHANLQIPQADIYFKGFQKEPVWYLWMSPYGWRYVEANYSGTNKNFPFFKIIGTWPSQVVVKKGGDETYEQSLLDIYANPKIELDGDTSLWNSWTNSGENERLADNMKRANDVMAVMQNYAQKLGFNIDNLLHIEKSVDLEQIRDAFQDLRKIHAYWVDMWPGVQSIDFLISSNEIDDHKILLVAKQRYSEADELFKKSKDASLSSQVRKKAKKDAQAMYKRAKKTVVAWLDQQVLEWMVAEYARKKYDSDSALRIMVDSEGPESGLNSSEIRDDLKPLYTLLLDWSNGIVSNLSPHPHPDLDYPPGWWGYDLSDFETIKYLIENVDKIDPKTGQIYAFSGSLGTAIRNGVIRGLSREYVQTQESNKTNYFDLVVKH